MCAPRDSLTFRLFPSLFASRSFVSEKTSGFQGTRPTVTTTKKCAGELALSHLSPGEGSRVSSHRPPRSLVRRKLLSLMRSLSWYELFYFTALIGSRNTYPCVDTRKEIVELKRWVSWPVLDRNFHRILPKFSTLYSSRMRLPERWIQENVL